MDSSPAAQAPAAHDEVTPPSDVHSRGRGSSPILTAIEIGALYVPGFPSTSSSP